MVADNPHSLPIVSAGPPEDVGDGCARLDPQVVLRSNARSFALRVRGQSMANAGICDGDMVVGEFTPQARAGAIVVALVDGEAVIKRLVQRNGQLKLISENPNCPDPIALSEVVIQGTVHTLVRRVV